VPPVRSEKSSAADSGRAFPVVSGALGRGTRFGGDEGASPFASDERLHELLATAGWAGAQSETREHVTTFARPEDWLPFSWSVGTRTYWERTPQEQRPELERTALEHLTRMAAEPQGLAQHNHVRYTTARAS